jgi:hypothetical protein
MNLDALTVLQFQVVHRHQLLRAGISPSAISRRLRSGEWQRLLPAVYALFAHEALTRQRLVAALLYAGADAQFGGRTALRLHGLRQVHHPDAELHLLVPHHRQLGSTDFAVLHRTTRLPDPAAAYPTGRSGARPLPPARVPLCPLPRAIADTARWGAGASELRTIVAEAVQDRLVTVAGLRAELAGSQRNRTAVLRAVLDELAGPAGSPAEADLRASLLQSRVLPQILWNPRLRAADGRPLPGPEAWIPDAALGLQIDGLEINGREVDPAEPEASAAWERAEARRDVLAAHGAMVLAFPLSRLRRDPAGIRLAVERAYLQRRLSGIASAIRHD